MKLTKNKLQVALVLVLVVLVAWWASFQHIVSNQSLTVQRFEYCYGVMALIGSLIGFAASRKWGGLKTVLGRALGLFSLGLLAQEAGQLIYSYYTVIDKIQIPYPSLGDVAYFGSTLLYIAAALTLAKAAGVGFSLRKSHYKAIAVLLPIIILSVSYTVLLHNHHYNTSKPVTVFLDAGYPLGEACYISIAVVAYLLSRKMIGGVMKSGILLIIVALAVQYLSDFTFVYQGDRGKYLPGQYDDLFYLLAYFTMASAMVRFIGIYNHIKRKTNTDRLSKEVA
jgi:hypothetical protein